MDGDDIPGVVSSVAVSELKSHLGFWLRMVSNDVSHRFALRLAGSGVTVAEWVILREMFKVDVTSPSALASVIGLTRGAVSKLIERLKEKKLLTRVESAGDRRFQDVSLTAAGRAIVPELAALADTNDREFFAALSTEERAGLASMLKKLAQANQLNRIPVE
jgi:DNA-binding MarR family transcriptional regulator